MEITARVTADAQVKHVGTDTKLTAFSVVINDSVKPKNGERKEYSTYFNCAYFISTGITQYLTKGTIVQLQGRLSVRPYAGTDGEPKASLNFHCNNIKILGGGSKPQQGDNSAKANDSSSTANPPYTTGNEADDLPF